MPPTDPRSYEQGVTDGIASERLRVPPTDPTAALRTAGYRFDALLDEMIMAGWEGEFDARERAALNRLGWFQARAEPVQSGPPERRVRVSPPGVANSALASQADDPSDRRICRLHGLPQDDPRHEYKYPDCENAGYAEADDPSGPDDSKSAVAAFLTAPWDDPSDEPHDSGPDSHVASRVVADGPRSAAASQADDPGGPDVDAAWEALDKAINCAVDAHTVRLHRPIIEAAIRAEYVVVADAAATYGYEQARLDALRESPDGE